MTKANRYISTADIKAAVRGQEVSVLQGLGIDWTGLPIHIDCPYPDHGGKSDWRWDEQKSVAFCTCIGKRPGEKRAHNIFAVVMCRLGIDFEAAKIHVAELIGRRDVVKAKGGGSATAQKQDVDSLLYPAAGNRDDALVWAYLGARLGVDPDAVPRPTTPVAGIRTLGYFDSPATRNAKPKFVATIPCAVFAQINREGQRHAHRIYLTPDGHGKAELGIGPNGELRDPKKSARAAREDNTVGRSVLWGKPETATCTLAFEGVETAAAAALGFRPEIDDGRVLVAACISANGIEAFQPWPACTNLFVGADRDEGIKPDGRERDRRGERAARKLCMQHYQTIRCGIALPGAPGEKVDWLDILRRDGVQAVREGLLNAVEFLPTQEDLDAAAQRQSRAAELDEIAKTYPLPRMDSISLIYAQTADDKVWVHKVIHVNEERTLIAITTPFGVPARLRHADQANAYGLRCLVQDMSGKVRAVDFDRGLLAKMGAAEVLSRLYQAGLRTENDGDKIVVQALKAADPDREIIVVSRPGWQQVPGYAQLIFVGPDGIVIGTSDGVDPELAASVRMPSDVARAGTLDDWRTAVAIAVAVDDCQHWILGVIAGFAGTLLGLTGLPSCGVDLSGLSTLGKSSAQRLAVSAWSSPDIRRKGLFQSANTTGNSIEPLAHRATGTVLALDDLAHVGGKAVAAMIYVIAGDVGKTRMNADSSLRESYTWSTFTVLSCECSLEEKVRSDGGEWRAGMAVRFPDIDVTGVNGNVDRATLDAIDAIERNYGHAGPAFVRALVEHGLHRQATALRERIMKAASAIAGSTDGAMVRAAIPFALLLVGGEMAVRFGLLPPETQIKEAVQWAWDRFKGSSDAAALDPVAQTIENLQRWVAERWDVTIKRLDPGCGINNREAVAWYDNDMVYIPKGRIREAAGNAVKESQIGKILDEQGLLAAKTQPDRFTIGWVPKYGRLTAYALSRKAFGRSDYDTEPDSFMVHQGGRHA